MSDWHLDRTRYFMSVQAWKTLPSPLRRRFRVVRDGELAVEAGTVRCLFSTVSEVITGIAPDFETGENRYAFLMDEVPVQELLRLQSILNLHKPHRRVHLTRDPGIFRRAAISLLRDEPVEAILDAWMCDDDLCLLLSDLSTRRVDPASVPSLRRIPRKVLGEFSIDPDGSYLHWSHGDLHLGVSQILQAVDPQFLAQLEIDRNALDYSGWALREWRDARGLRQVDIRGISERHVNRVEQGVSRLTVSTAEAYARSFHLSTGVFLDELARRTRTTREEVERQRVETRLEAPEIVVIEQAA